MKPRPLAVRPEELRAIRSALCRPPSRGALRRRTGGPGPGGRGGRCHSLGLLTPTPPTGATSRRRPPRGAFLIPRPLAEELHLLSVARFHPTDCNPRPLATSPLRG